MQKIDVEHPEYVARKKSWKTYRDLYVGGEQLKQNAAEYLMTRQNEPGDVYRERLSRVFYENYLGSIVDWYVATLFRREPLVRIGGFQTQTITEDIHTSMNLHARGYKSCYLNKVLSAGLMLEWLG